VWELAEVPDIAGVFDPLYGAMLLVPAAMLTPARPIPRGNIEAVVRISFRTFTSSVPSRWQIAALPLPGVPERPISPVTCGRSAAEPRLLPRMQKQSTMAVCSNRQARAAGSKGTDLAKSTTTLAMRLRGGALFHVVLIKPTHYDDDGYPIQWVKAAIPSNTLACLNGLAEDASRRQVFGSDVVIRVPTYDETNRRVRPDRIIRMVRRAGGHALIGPVGVQSNQFLRAADLARPFVRAGLPVCIGGFHVSGCIAMLPEMPQEMREAARLGISFFAGEAEHGQLDRVIRDAWQGSLQPLYNYMSDLPSLEGEPAPILPRKHVRRVSGQLSSLDLGRGCPYQCSFCTIINVQAARAGFALLTISSARSVKTTAKVTGGSSSPMITSRAIAIGSRSLIG
jgi:hypothetical protein